ncbi:MAG: ABC transporter substrate-binding protein, partial [Nitrososphaerales archaeon]
FVGDFANKEERDKLLNDAVRIGVNESVRIFVVSMVDPYIVSKDVSGVVNDFSAGLTSRFTLIDARADDARNLKVGVKQIYQDAWNPIEGFSSVYSSRLFTAISDPGTFRHPYTGDVIPVRTPYEVETAGPSGKLEVPQDAVRWDPISEEWVNVGEGVEATSKVTFELINGNWHNGMMMDKNDVLYSTYFAFEWGTNEGENDPTVDTDYTAKQEPIIKTIKGYRFVSDNKIESYFDFWHFDQKEIAGYDSVWTTMPWEITAAMERVVLDGKAAFSKSVADEKKVDWLSLMISNNANLIKETLEQFKQESYVPKSLRDSVGASEAVARYDATIKWIDEKNHAVVSNGPFYLQGYNPEARTITIKAFRDDSYPFEIGKWKEFEEARVATLGNVNVPLSITRGTDIILSGDVRVDGDPSRDVKVYYFLKNSNGEVGIKGEVSPSSDGKFQINLSKDDTMKLSAGSNELKLLAISNLALKPDVYTT